MTEVTTSRDDGQAALREEVARLRAELSDKARAMEQLEARRKEKEDVARNALAELQVGREREEAVRDAL